MGEADRRASVVRAALGLAWRTGRASWLGTIGFAVVCGVMTPVSAWVLKELINHLTGPAPALGPVAALAAAAVLLGTLSLSLSSLSSLTAAACQRTISVAVAADLYAAVNRIQGLRHFERPDFQDSLRLAESAAEETPTSLTTTLAALLQGGTTIAGFAGILVATWPPMLPLLVAACVPTAVVQFALMRRSAQTSEAMMSRYRRWFQIRGLLSEPRAVMEIRLLGLGEFFRSRLVGALSEATGAEYAIKRRIAWAQSGLSLLGGAITAAGAVTVAMHAARGGLGVGAFVMFLVAVSGTQGALIGTVNESLTLTAALRLLRHYTDVLHFDDDLAPVRPVSPRAPGSLAAGAGAVPALRHGIEFRDVWFGYQPGDWVLRGVCAELALGRATALVGANGAGKSTLIKLLSRFYDPQRGAILWDGIDLRELDPAELRRRMAIAFQDFLTYDLTIAENIGIGCLAAGDDRVKIAAAARLVGLDDKISALPAGYDTMLSSMFTGDDGEQGATLSGGQRQRLTLARTLMRHDADLMVLDEPSSGLDAQAEHQIHQRLACHRSGRTTLLVSHRLSALRDADQILVLDAGRITERGTHDQLMTAAGSYARLFALQAHGYQDDRVAAGLSAGADSFPASELTSVSPRAS
ncbi:MAG TPA: ABC transporter ATP-binding protein [Streptosporangiaceae bacterium]|nr:ABC transporter ATP-binding protein [Streptosporangiaceae bacterium]